LQKRCARVFDIMFYGDSCSDTIKDLKHLWVGNWKATEMRIGRQQK